MAATTSTERRELAQRTGDGIEVSLYWNAHTDRVTIVVFDLRSYETLVGRRAANSFS